MDREEALAVVRRELAAYRIEAYQQLLRLLTHCEEMAVVGPSGAGYRIQIEAVWDDQPNGALRVWGLIDDGSLWRFVCPLSDDFIMRPDGTFVSE